MPFPSTESRAAATQEDPHHPWLAPSSFGEEPTVGALNIDDANLTWWRPADISSDRLNIRPMGTSTLIQASEMAADNLVLGPLADAERLTGAGVFLMHEFEPRHRLLNSEVARFDEHESLLPARF